MEEPQDAVGRRSVGPGLLEREAELAAISNAVAAAAEGRGSLLAIEGQAGIGKSRLLAAARALAADRGLDVAAARGSELERSLPFGAVRQLFEARVVRARNTPEDPVRGAAELAAPVFDPAAFDAAPDGGSLLSRLHGLYWLLVNLAEDRPLLVVVDDVHWIDDASLRLLRYLAPRVADLPVAIAVATRPPDDPTGAAAVAPLLTDPDVAVLRPSPLSADAVAALVETAVAAAADPRFVEACLEATAGNPFLLRELLAEVAERGLDASRVAADEVRRLGPGAIAASLLGRLGRVSPAATQLVRSLVILGDGTAVHVAGAFAGLDGDDALHAAHLLEATGLVEADDGLRFVHPIVRQAVYQDLTAVERGRRHAAAAAFLRGAGAAPEAVAAHLLHAPPAGEAATVAALRRAARRAAALGDTGVAAGYLLRALREPPPQEDLAAVLGELGRAEAEAGVPEAVEHLEACLALEPPAEIDLPAAEALANVLVFAGRPDRGAAVLEEALRRSSSGDGAEQRMRALLATVGCVGMPVRRRLLPMLHRFRDPGGPARDADDVRALAMLAATAAFDDNDGDRAADLGLRALAAPIEEPSDAATASARVALAVSLMIAEEPAAADGLLTEMLEGARRAGARARAIGLTSARALVRWHHGHPASAEADALEALELLPEAHGAEMLAHAGLAAAVLAGLELDRPRTALEALLADAEPWLDPSLLPYSQVLIARGRLLLTHGEPEAALEAFLACDLDATGWGRDTPSLVPWRSGAALCLGALGRDDEAAALAAQELALARRFGRPRCVGVSLRATALAGPPGARDDALAEAVATLRRADAPLELARALVDHGTVLRLAGRRSDARAALDEAHALADRVGATRLAAEARRELRTLGARPRATAGAGLGSLTAAERRVADLAAAGRTNREIAQALFVSEKTVETHLARVFRKLGIASRRQLPALLAGAG